MKVAINVRYGGFSLSRAAVKRMAELQGRACYFFTHDLKQMDHYIPSDEKTDGRDLFFTAFDIPNPNEVLRTRRLGTICRMLRNLPAINCTNSIVCQAVGWRIVPTRC